MAYPLLEVGRHALAVGARDRACAVAAAAMHLIVVEYKRGGAPCGRNIKNDKRKERKT